MYPHKTGESEIKMDQRSIMPGLAAAPLFMINPQTGEMVTPLGHTKNGRPIWPVIGGAPEEGEGEGEGDGDDGDDDGDEGEEDDDDDDDGDDDGEGEEGKKGKSKKGNAQAKIKALEEEKDRHFRKARKANKRAEAAEAALAEMKAKYESGDDDGDAGKGKEGEKPKTKPVDDAKLKAAKKRAQELQVENAFLMVNEIDWINKGQVMTLLQADDDYEIEFDDDGKVDRKSLKAELKRFAKANPHLVKKPAAKTDDGDDADDEGGNGSKSTASKMNGKRKGKGNQPKTREELAKKFPALNRMR